MRKCVVCGISEKRGKLLFRFSKNLEKRREWIAALGFEEENLRLSADVVCEVRKIFFFLIVKALFRRSLNICIITGDT